MSEIKIGDTVEIISKTFRFPVGTICRVVDVADDYCLLETDKDRQWVFLSRVQLVKDARSSRKIGDTVTIKSIDWYNTNKNYYGYIDCGNLSFTPSMASFCGKSYVIKQAYSHLGRYRLEGCGDVVFVESMLEPTSKAPIEIDDEPVLVGDIPLIKDTLILTNLSTI